MDIISVRFIAQCDCETDQFRILGRRYEQRKGECNRRDAPNETVINDAYHECDRQHQTAQTLALAHTRKPVR